MQSGWQDPPPQGGIGGGGMQFAMPTLTPVVKRLILINVVVFLVSAALTLDGSGGLWIPVQNFFGVKPDRWISLIPPVWQVVTYGFLHDPFDPMHLLGNMLFLYFLGTMLEGILGGRRFIVFFLSAIVLAGLAQLVLGLARGEHFAMIGASGGVLAVVTATATLRPSTRVIFILFPITLRTLAFIYVGLDLWRMFGDFRGDPGRVAYMAHLGGALWGYLAVRRGWIWRDPVLAYQGWRARAEEEQAAADEVRLDDVLNKINREGIHSLSAREKAFLKRASKRR